MKLSDLDFSFPEELVATSPARPSRVLLVQNQQCSEISIDDLLKLFSPGDVLVINDTKVLKRRLFVEGREILFLDSADRQQWQVLMPCKDLHVGDSLDLREGAVGTLLEKGRPQIIKVNKALEESFFEKHGEIPLPPYIQKQRGERQSRPEDEQWYQTAWAQVPGSFASPTASLHFTAAHMQQLRQKSVQILTITLHVGLGTFLPVQEEDFKKHTMHEEFLFVDAKVMEQIKQAKSKGHKVWILGTTALRAVESAAHQLIPLSKLAKTNLMITPGFEFLAADCLLTNFHQPKSTLLALVAAFKDLQTVKRSYAWAIDKKFKLFSYGDLSVWIR
jgi:S-adenosylmethionine:tRNA ribosyltransferase-isomerase